MCKVLPRVGGGFASDALCHGLSDKLRVRMPTIDRGACVMMCHTTAVVSLSCVMRHRQLLFHEIACLETVCLFPSQVLCGRCFLRLPRGTLRLVNQLHRRHLFRPLHRGLLLWSGISVPYCPALCNLGSVLLPTGGACGANCNQPSHPSTSDLSILNLDIERFRFLIAPCRAALYSPCVPGHGRTAGGKPGLVHHPWYQRCSLPAAGPSPVPTRVLLHPGGSVPLSTRPIR